MNGIRTLVLQDLPHILPSRGRQLHASVSCRRIWNFFDFSLKEDASYRTPTKCTSSKDISSLLSSNEFKSISINRVCLSAGSPSGPNLDPKVHVYHFDQKSKSVGSPRVPRPLSQPDNLVSLLDGNPVPKTMKWKLKGYKTLRNEESSDFAFVPGGNPYDLDILSRNKQGNSPELKKADTGNKDTLCLTNRAIENKTNVMKSEMTVEPNEIVKAEGTSDSLNEQSVATAKTLETACNKTPGETTGGMLRTGVSKMDQFLPISKNELSTASKAQCQLPPKVQYSSQSSNSISKPLPPGMSKDEQLMDSSTRPSYVDKPMSAPSAESYRQRATEVHVPQESPPQTVASGYTNSKCPSMEQQGRLTEQKVDDLYRANNNDGQMQTSRLSLPVPEKKVAEPSVSVAKSGSKYFAPRRWNYPNVPASNLSFNLDGKSANESILSVLPKHKPLKISGPQANYPVGTSPCAATRSRLHAAGSKQLQSGFQNESQGQTGSPGLGGSMTGGSEGGSRKPPAYCPSITMKRSSSNAPSFTKNIKRTQKPINKNSSSNISTSSACLAPKKCKGEEEMTEGKTICTKPRQNKGCKQRRKKKEKKVCKRYCCPELQETMDCNFSEVQCPKDGKKPVAKSRGTKDPTCLSNEKDAVEREGGREICTKPRRRENDRERSCSRERRRRSCSRNESSSRKRSRSCKRQERRDCSRNREDQGGREICTKPRKRESCNRQRGSDRDCGQRSAKCSGRRNFTHSAFTGRRKSAANMRRYSSLPAFTISLIGMKSSGETKQNLFETPVNGRFYGKQPFSCKSPKSSEKCEKPASNTDVKCKSAKKTETACKSPQKTEDKCKPAKKTESTCKTTKKTEPKCKTQEPKSTVRKYEAICKSAQKTESKCKTAPKKTESKCKTTPKKTETTCKSAKKTESKCKVTQKSDPCKVRSKSDDHCAKKREQVCKDRKTALSASSHEESAKDRMEREKREMEECKKHIKRSKKGKDKKKAENMVPKGLERVVSPCKQKQSGKGGKDPSRKMSCVGVPLDCLTKNTIGHVIPMSDNKSFAILPDRHYSMMRSFSDDQLQSWDTKSGDEAKFWMNNEEEFGPDAIPVPIETENEDDKLNNNSIYSNPSWFTSWFDNDRF